MVEIDVQKLILEELQEIKGEVRHIPAMQARVDAMKNATQQLETAMRESTAALQMQATAHGKLLDELRLEQHRSTAGMMGISNDLQALIPRVRDLERQVAASFQQQQQLSRDVREAAGFPDPDEYKTLKAAVETLPELREDVKGLKKYLTMLHGLDWFIKLLLFGLAGAGVTGLLWLLGQALTKGF